MIERVEALGDLFAPVLSVSAAPSQLIGVTLAQRGAAAIMGG